MTNVRRIIALGAALLTIAISGGSALACQGSIAVTSCTATCNSNCFLNTDLNCTNGQGITLNSGAKLDLCGHTMNCTSLICYTAGVTMTASSSQVLNTISGPPNNSIGKFTGEWYPAVECANKSASKVLGVRFEGVTRAAQNCSKFQQNVVASSDPFGYATSGIAGTDEVSDNYFNSGSAINLTGAFAGSVHDNLIAMNDTTGGFADGIVADQYAYGAFNVSNNIFLGNGASSVPITDDSIGSPTYATNYCDPLNSNCTTCISSGKCTSPQVSFTLP